MSKSIEDEKAHHCHSREVGNLG